MATIKGLTGNPTIAAGGTSLQIINYGVPINVSLTDLDGVALRNTIIVLPAHDSFTITQQPVNGRAIARDDGRITIDLIDIRDTTPLIIGIETVLDGVATSDTYTITLAPAEQGNGWPGCNYYMLETDAANRIVVEPGDNHRKLHMSTTGFSKADIVAREPSLTSEAQVNTAWLTNNVATGFAPLKYGENPDVALDQATAMPFFRYMVAAFGTPWLLLKRGDVFGSSYTGAVDTIIQNVGQSALHPVLITAYGNEADPLPRFAGTGPRLGNWGWNIVIQDFAYNSDMRMENGGNFISDGGYCDYLNVVGNTSQVGKPLQMNPTNIISEGMTLRRFYSIDSVTTAPDNGTTWDNSNDRCGGVYVTGVKGLLIEQSYVDLAGWAYGYRADGDGSAPKIADDRSHAFYLQNANGDVTVSNVIATRASHSSVQFRPGGIINNFVAVYGNTGVNPGAGPEDYDPGGMGNAGHWSMLYRLVMTSAGLKDVAGFSRVVGGAIKTGAQRVSIVDSAAINMGDPVKVFSGGTDTGPGSNGTTFTANRAFPLAFEEGSGYPLGTTSRNALIVSNWNRAHFADENVGNVPLATRDALTVMDYNDQWKGVTGSTLEDFCESLRAEAAPWDQVTPILDYFLGPFGKASSQRSVAQTVTFLPDPEGDTPGHMAHLACDWDTGDLPGHVAGDSIDLSGHRVVWNMNPANPINNFTFGSGGRLNMKGGTLKPSGTVTPDAGGNVLTMRRGSKFHIAGRSGGVLSVDAIEARFLNTGNINGVDIAARYMSEAVLAYDAASFTLGSGRTLSIYGYGKAGFDGAVGGAAAITLATGSLTEFKPTIRMAIDGMTEVTKGVFDPDETGGSQPIIKDTPRPPLGAVVTGAGGATGVVVGYIKRSNTTAWLMLDQLTGVFADNEALTANCDYGLFEQPALYAGFQFGTVNGAPSYVLGSLAEFRTGINGTAAPNVASAVTLGGTLHLDITGVANGTYQIISADTVTGAFDAVTATGNAAKDIAIAVSGTGVSITVAAGTGMIT